MSFHANLVWCSVLLDYLFFLFELMLTDLIVGFNFIMWCLLFCMRCYIWAVNVMSWSSTTSACLQLLWPSSLLNSSVAHIIHWLFYENIGIVKVTIEWVHHVVAKVLVWNRPVILDEVGKEILCMVSNGSNLLDMHVDGGAVGQDEDFFIDDDDTVDDGSDSD